MQFSMQFQMLPNKSDWSGYEVQITDPLTSNWRWRSTL